MSKLYRVTGSRTTIVLELGRSLEKVQLSPDEADKLALELIRKADASRALARLTPTKVKR